MVDQDAAQLIGYLFKTNIEGQVVPSYELEAIKLIKDDQKHLSFLAKSLL